MVKLTSPAKGNATLPKHHSPPLNKYKLNGSPKKDNNEEKVKDIIININKMKKYLKCNNNNKGKIINNNYK